MFQNFILKAGVRARAIRSRMERFCRVIQVFRSVPKAPVKMDLYTSMGSIPVVMVVRIPQSTRARTMAKSFFMMVSSIS